jgi:hypothetical protein
MRETYRYNPEIKPEIPGYKGRIYNFGKERIPIHLDQHKWEFETEKGVREVPVLSVWSPNNRKSIAQAIIEGKRIAMYMWGTYGTGYLVNFPEWQDRETDEAKDLRENLKIGRPKNMSFPVIVHPDDEGIFWNFDELHSDLQNLRNANKRYDLHSSGPVHIIAPTKNRNPYLDESAKWEKDKTACFYYMPHPAWEKIIGETRRYVKHAVFQGGSLNPHQKDPVYTSGNLYEQIKQTPQWAEKIDMVAICEISEYFQIFRGQTQIRLARKGSGGVSEIVRYGGMSTKRWSEEQGILLKEASEGAKTASSLWEYTDENNEEIDRRVVESMRQMKDFARNEKKLLKG